MAQPQRVLADPPKAEHKHLAKNLTAPEAAPLLADYLEKSRKAPWMHPDAWLYSEGVRHGPKGGPSGGWAIHHLRRIEAGLRGEKLEAETKEELIAKFGEDGVPGASASNDVHGSSAPNDLQNEAKPKRTSDDTRLDAVIKNNQEQVDDEKAEKAKKKKEKKEKVAREKAERLGTTANAPAVEGAPNEKKKRKDKKRKHAEDEGWQTKEEFEQSQTVLEGEVGERDGAPVSKQGGPPPVVVEHDASGEVVVPKKGKTEEDKAARRAAKKARRQEEKAEKKDKKKSKNG